MAAGPCLSLPSQQVCIFDYRYEQKRENTHTIPLTGTAPCVVAGKLMSSSKAQLPTRGVDDQAAGRSGFLERSKCCHQWTQIPDHQEAYVYYIRFINCFGQNLTYKEIINRLRFHTDPINFTDRIGYRSATVVGRNWTLVASIKMPIGS
jgi:hypothetical protein